MLPRLAIHRWENWILFVFFPDLQHPIVMLIYLQIIDVIFIASNSASQEAQLLIELHLETYSFAAKSRKHEAPVSIIKYQRLLTENEQYNSFKFSFAFVAQVTNVTIYEEYRRPFIQFNYLKTYLRKNVIINIALVTFAVVAGCRTLVNLVTTAIHYENNVND
ncbi:hypothetical protein BDF20DRAFT_832215 [Mycotypha africana]|uniref:uncharacterized protein n=1 Tax=Mycotypha africana TaxID=64632 RepID=UPI002300442A|nr:uncharacterized protein BDF20DRAFT_832215 [Mycotypha africana]KAI8987267.1 hypothetical protein BDF20DRAFT_832215 [Mycotypha africana]